MLELQYYTLYPDAFLSDVNKVYETSLIKFLQSANIPYSFDDYGIDFLDAYDVYIPGTKYQINNFFYHLLRKFTHICAAEIKASPKFKSLLTKNEYLTQGKGYDVKKEIDSINKTFTELYYQYDSFMQEIESYDEDDKNEFLTMIDEWREFTKDITDIFIRFFIKSGFIINQDSSGRYHCADIIEKDRLAINGENFLSEVFEFIATELTKTDSYQQEAALMNELGFANIEEVLTHCFGAPHNVNLCINQPHILHCYNNSGKSNTCAVNDYGTPANPSFTP